MFCFVYFDAKKVKKIICCSILDLCCTHGQLFISTKSQFILGLIFDPLCICNYCRCASDRFVMTLATHSGTLIVILILNVALPWYGHIPRSPPMRRVCSLSLRRPRNVDWNAGSTLCRYVWTVRPNNSVPQQSGGLVFFPLSLDTGFYISRLLFYVKIVCIHTGYSDHCCGLFVS